MGQPNLQNKLTQLDGASGSCIRQATPNTHDGTDAALPHAPYPMRGVGPFTHTNRQDRPPEIFGGKNTLHFANGKMPYLLLPAIPPR